MFVFSLSLALSFRRRIVSFSPLQIVGSISFLAGRSDRACFFTLSIQDTLDI